MIDFNAQWSPAERDVGLRDASLRPTLAPPTQGAVSLAMGEPDFDTPAEITEAAYRAMRSGHTHYADQQGLPELRTAIAAQLPGAARSADEVLITHGATGALATLILSTVSPGDRVVIPEPAYSLYADLITMAGGTVVYVPLDETLHWDLGRLQEALPDARMVIFSNPANPTGICHSENELRALGLMLEGTQTLVVADEAYHRIVFPGNTFRSALEITELSDRTAYVQTFSKTYAMTGWRIGYLTAPRSVVQSATRFHRTINGSLNTATQMAALRALDLEESRIEPMLSAYKERRAIMLEELSRVPGLELTAPEGAFYAFPRYAFDMPAEKVAHGLGERGLIVRPGTEYGPSGEGHIRLSFAASEDAIRTGVSRLRAYFEESVDRLGKEKKYDLSR